MWIKLTTDKPHDKPELVNLTRFNKGDIEDLNDLLGEFDENAPIITEAKMKIWDTPMYHVVLMCDPSQAVRGTFGFEKGIIGMTFLIILDLPTGRSAQIEDVVVRKAFRNKGYGTRMVKMAVDKAEECGCEYIDLTSRPSRKAANHIYANKFGFKKRETNPYRLMLKK